MPKVTGPKLNLHDFLGRQLLQSGHLPHSLENLILFLRLPVPMSPSRGPLLQALSHEHCSPTLPRARRRSAATYQIWGALEAKQLTPCRRFLFRVSRPLAMLRERGRWLFENCPCT